MVYCPECELELHGNPSHCYICGRKMTETRSEADWIVLGTVENKMYADLARETLISANVPAVVISKSGFFGNIGLPLVPFYKPQSSTFEIRVPREYLAEASEILDMTIGDKWQKEDIH